MGETNFRSHCGRVQASVAASMCVIFLTLTGFLVTISAAGDQPPASIARRPRARDIGLKIGILPVGKQNAITDVPGVRVGHTTVVQGQGVRTGVTVILPHGENIFQDKVPAAIAVGNGFGKLVGVTQVNELGVLETPIALTNTLSTFAVADALLTYTLNQPGNETIGSVNPVVGECNDGVLNDIRGRNITAEHVQSAIDGATAGVVLEGSVGAGTGTRCMGWKGGIGTSSRLTPKSSGRYSVGVLVQTNFNGVLNVAGVPVGRELGRYYLKDQTQFDRSVERGSCIVVVATDAPLDARQLQRLARRALLGLAAVGSPMTHGSGDYVIAFSVHKEVRVRYRSAVAVERKPTVRDDRLSPLFLATKEATEEAVINSLLRATSVTGFRGRTSDAISIERVIEICKKHGAIRETASAP
jgi:D-aminopeptidase